MEFRLKCEKPGDILYTLTATMTADQWEKVRERLQEANAPCFEPGGQLIDAINNLLTQARRIYWPAEPARPPKSSND